MPSVYLAGPITGCSYDGAVDWREVAAEELLAAGLYPLSPMRGKLYLLQETSIGDSYEETVLSSQKGITARDRWDCSRCDVALVNLLGAERVSIGTMMELGWLDAARVPIVLVLEEGSIHDHAMVREVSGFIVPTLTDGIHTIKALLPRYSKRTALLS